VEENRLKNRFYSYLFYGTAILVFFASLFFGNAFLLLITAILLLLCAVYFNSGHIVNNLLVKRSKIIEVYNEYRLSNDLYSASKKVGDSYRSVSIAMLRFDNNASIKPETFKSILEGLKVPFEFGINIAEVDRKRLIESLSTKKRMLEISLSRLDSRAYDKINHVKSEIEILENDIKGILGGGKSFNIAIKLKTASASQDLFEAEREAKRNIESLANSFATALGVEYEIVKGESLLEAVEVY
jgi:hypothetical protein